jgi:hypothetical protein
MHAALLCGLARHPFEQQHLVGQRQRIAMQEIDLQLRGTRFMDQSVERQSGRCSIVVEAPHHRLELFQRLHVVGMLHGFGAAIAPNRSGQRPIGIGIGRGQVEFELRRHHGPPSTLAVEIEHGPQHMPRRGHPWLVVRAKRIGKDISLARSAAGRKTERCDIRHHPHVWILIGKTLVDGPRIAAVYADQKCAARQIERTVLERLQELGSRQGLAAQDAVHVRHQALDLAYRVPFQPASLVIRRRRRRRIRCRVVEHQVTSLRGENSFGGGSVPPRRCHLRRILLGGESVFHRRPLGQGWHLPVHPSVVMPVAAIKSLAGLFRAFRRDHRCAESAIPGFTGSTAAKTALASLTMET